MLSVSAVTLGNMNILLPLLTLVIGALLGAVTVLVWSRRAGDPEVVRVGRVPLALLGPVACQAPVTPGRRGRSAIRSAGVADPDDRRHEAPRSAGRTR